MLEINQRGEIVIFDDSNRGRRFPEWEPEPLELPLELPRDPESRDEAPAPEDAEPRFVVIDLV